MPPKDNFRKKENSKNGLLLPVRKHQGTRITYSKGILPIKKRGGRPLLSLSQFRFLII